MQCPKCSSTIPSQSINVSTDIAQCLECNFIFRISEHVGSSALPTELANFDITDPPKGAWIEQHDTDVELGVSTRSFIAFFYLPFMLVWSGGSLGGIYGIQLINGEFDPFISLFGIPFIIGTFFLGSLTAKAIAGKIIVKINNDTLEVFTGVGKLGRTQSVELDKISKVSEHTTRSRKGGSSTAILVEGARNIEFGGELSLDRRKYILKALQKIVHDKENNLDFIHQDLSRHLLE